MPLKCILISASLVVNEKAATECTNKAVYDITLSDLLENIRILFNYIKNKPKNKGKIRKKTIV